jgi:hypothetical protein
MLPLLLRSLHAACDSTQIESIEAHLRTRKSLGVSAQMLSLTLPASLAQFSALFLLWFRPLQHLLFSAPLLLSSPPLQCHSRYLLPPHRYPQKSEQGVLNASQAEALFAYSSRAGYTGETTLFGFELGEELTSFKEGTPPFAAYTASYHAVAAASDPNHHPSRSSACMSSSQTPPPTKPGVSFRFIC